MKTRLWFHVLPSDGAPPYYSTGLARCRNTAHPEETIGQKGSLERSATSPDLIPTKFFSYFFWCI